jgi:hypothetical protein
MCRGSRAIFLVCMLVITATRATAQSPKPWSVGDIEELLTGGVMPKHLVDLIEKKGVDFVLTDDIRKRLRQAGADDPVLRAVEQAALAVKKRQDEQNKRVGQTEAAAAPPSDMVEVSGGNFFSGCNEKVEYICDYEELGRRMSLPSTLTARK